MQVLLRWIARLAGLAGLAMCAGAILARLGGLYVVGGFQVGTLLLGGIAVMLVGCLSYLALIAERDRD